MAATLVVRGISTNSMIFDYAVTPEKMLSVNCYITKNRNKEVHCHCK